MAAVLGARSECTANPSRRLEVPAETSSCGESALVIGGGALTGHTVAVGLADRRGGRVVDPAAGLVVVDVVAGCGTVQRVDPAAVANGLLCLAGVLARVGFV